MNRINSKTPHLMEGQKFGRLTLVSLDFPSKSGNRRWRCKCDCGNFPSTREDRLWSGVTVSCGCFRAEELRKRKTSHGLSKSNFGLYSTWKSMIQRCYNRNNPAYKNYGGRGISMCERWRKSFQNFMEDMGPKPISQERLSIDRVDVNGPYSRENCRWATDEVQAQNKREKPLHGSVAGFLALEIGQSFVTPKNGYGSIWPVAKRLNRKFRAKSINPKCFQIIRLS